MFQQSVNTSFPNVKKATPGARLAYVNNQISDIGNTPSLTAYPRWGKRLVDIVLVVLILPLALPLMAVMLVLIALEGGKPIFRHPRVGKDARIFGCFKFRTMAIDAEARLKKILREDPAAAEEWAMNFKLRDDPRVTRIGRIARKTSLDELPQLWNVLRGDMSLVGPRPVTEAEMPLYGRSAEDYYMVRPGLTGIWQVSGRNSLSFVERVKLDRAYVAHLSLFADLRIMLLTVPAVLHVTGF